VVSDRLGVQIDSCPQCRDVWLDHGERDKLIERSVTMAPTPASGAVARSQPQFADSDCVPPAARALKTSSADALVNLLADAVGVGVRARFHAAAERQRLNLNDMATGRRYVETYVPCVHHVERLWEATTGPVHGHPAEHEAQAHQSEHTAHHHYAGFSLPGAASARSARCTKQ
jgi:hypothetical protein